MRTTLRLVCISAEVKFKPPGTYPTLQEFWVCIRLAEPEATLRFVARLKSFVRGAGGGVKTRKSELERKVPISQFMPHGGMPNRALYREILAEVLEELTPTLLK